MNDARAMAALGTLGWSRFNRRHDTAMQALEVTGHWIPFWYRRI